MNNIWIVLEEYPYEDTIIVGVFDSELKAKLAANKFRSLAGSHPQYTVKGYEIE